MSTLLPSQRHRGKPSYDGDFRAGFESGAATLRGNPDADACDAAAEYRTVSREYGSWWLDGYCAAIDLARGAYATQGAQIAIAMGLTE